MIKVQVFEMQGNCLCEKVKLNLGKESNRVTACYCGMCRKWADGALFSIEEAYLENDITIEGKTWVSEYDSSAEIFNP